MHFRQFNRRPKALILAAGSLAALALTSVAPAQVSATIAAPKPALFGPHRVVATGLDNPRQLSLTARGDILIAEAGHGGTKKSDCVGTGEDATCVGKTGKVTRLHSGKLRTVIDGLLSGAGPDGSFAVGGDGASKRPGGAYYSIVTYAPPDVLRQGLPGWQSGRLLAKSPGGRLHAVANIARFEKRRDPDGEGFDSNPYSVLALKNQVLVADAAGDYIASVNNAGKVRLWAVLPEYGKKFDAVPTTLALGPDGRIYVGELHSETPGAAKVWQYDRHGNVLRSWGGFTTVTGVARGRDGSLYVSELFGGHCDFSQIPSCFPGRVTRVAPDGTRSYRRVPFPAGLVVKGGHAFVAAFSIAPATGAMGNPHWNGQIWRVF